MGKYIKKAIIPIAGLGTRLLPATIACSKTMIPIGNKPALQHILEECLLAGIEDVFIVASKYQEDVEKYISLFGQSNLIESFPLEIIKNKDFMEYYTLLNSFNSIRIIYQDEQLGLAHAIKQCEKYFSSLEYFVVILGDNPIVTNNAEDLNNLIFSANLEAEQFNYKNNYLLTQTVNVEDVNKYGIVVKSKNEVITHIVEKPSSYDMCRSTNAIMGRYILNGSIFEQIPEYTNKSLSYYLNELILQEQTIIAEKANIEISDIGTECGLIRTYEIYKKWKDKLEEDIEWS